jgi:NAD(P)-dependent dehydrogenase (short-subunit alcohol dehydrogenase family)
MDFQITFFRPIQLRKRYTLTGRVEFKSQPTSTLAESIEIRDSINNVDVYASGKINTKVNRPPIPMPGINFIKESAMDLGLKDKVALITGGSRGIGETTAKLFSLYGCRVAVNYSKGKNDADRVVSEIDHNGGEAIAVQADVSDKDQVKRMVSVIRESYGNINILINNAVKDFYPKAFMELTWKDFQGEIDVTIKGAFNCCQEILPSMMESKEGKIINVVTVATDNPPPNQAKYVASKSALVGLTRSLAIEFAPYGIQVNMVSPSIVETDLTKHIPKMFLDGMKHDTPMKRNAEAIDVAKAIIFLASNLSPFTTGQKIMVTGGAAPFL